MAAIPLENQKKCWFWVIEHPIANPKIEVKDTYYDNIKMDMII